jgi:hypothetical protein
MHWHTAATHSTQQGLTALSRDYSTQQGLTALGRDSQHSAGTRSTQQRLTELSRDSQHSAGNHSTQQGPQHSAATHSTQQGLTALSRDSQHSAGTTTLSRGHKAPLLPPTQVHIQNATLAGGVSIGSSANLTLVPAWSVMVGVLAGALSTLGYIYVTPYLEGKIKLHDTCGVHNLHGMPGEPPDLPLTLYDGLLRTRVAVSPLVVHCTALRLLISAPVFLQLHVLEACL